MLLPDELMVGSPGCLAQMVEAYEQVGGNVVAALEVPDRRDPSLWRDRPGRERRTADRNPRHGRKARARHRTVEPDAARPLHPPARGDARTRRAGARRRRRDPADRRHGAIDRQAAVPRLPLRRVSATIAAMPPGFVIANLAFALGRDDVAPRSARFSTRPKAAARRPSRDSRASFRGDGWAETPGHDPAIARSSGGSARAGCAYAPRAGSGRPS